MNSFLAVLCFSLTLALSQPAPVPYSTSESDGMPTEEDWNLFKSIHQSVLTSSVMAEQRAELLKYASDQVAASYVEVQQNLKNLSLQGFDSVWPGDGFNGVAYGGLYEVLLQLGLAGKRMGASGGAASAILCSGGSEMFLKFYQVYQVYYQGHPERIADESMRDTGVTAAIYAESMRNMTNFAKSQENTFIVSRCTSAGNTIFRGFATLKQLVAAGYSSGDASLGGFAVGTFVDGANVGHCADGGHITVFPESVASKGHGVLLYKTPWVSTMSPTAESIDKLFRAGVDIALAALKTPQLEAKTAGGSIASALPGPRGIVTAIEYTAGIGKPVEAQDTNLGASEVIV